MKVNTIIAIYGIAIFLVLAQSARFGQRLLENNNNKVAARQEQAASGPYPPAGVTPEIPFDLPSETEAPIPELDQTYIPPAESPEDGYLPPEPIPDLIYGPPPDKPDENYLPPLITEMDNAGKTNQQPAGEESLANESLKYQNNLIFKNLLEAGKRLRASLRSFQIKSRIARQSSRLAKLRLRSEPFQIRFNTVDNFESEPDSLSRFVLKSVTN